MEVAMMLVRIWGLVVGLCGVVAVAAAAAAGNVDGDDHEEARSGATAVYLGSLGLGLLSLAVYSTRAKGHENRRVGVFLRGLAFVLPVATAWVVATRFGLSGSGSRLSEENFQVPDIPINLVLKQNLALAKHSWEHGVLTHALLELQNPELTVFAGPGYGVHLRNPSPGAVLQAFPDGKLPMCRAGSGGRYDSWMNVKGLRYAAEKIETGRPGHRRGLDVGDGGERWWLFREGEDASPADAASLGWAALLLERADAVDPANPMSVGRNAYGEGADEMVRFLFFGGKGIVRFMLEENDRDDGVAIEEVGMRAVGASGGRQWALSHRMNSAQLWADSVFMVPPFLAAYAVARQSQKWLFEAVEQITAYAKVLTINDNGNTTGLWRHIVSQPHELEPGTCCHDENLWLTGNAWALAGMVRVFAVLERWDQRLDTRSDSSTTDRPSRRDQARTELFHLINRTLTALHVAALSGRRVALLNNYLDIPIPQDIQAGSFEDPAGSALIASSVYRLAQLEMLPDSNMLLWADAIYEAVARHVDKAGMLTPVASVNGIPCLKTATSTSEAQSFTLMMFAARRDCVKIGICRKSTSTKGWHLLPWS